MPLLAALAAAAYQCGGFSRKLSSQRACSTFYLGFGELILHRQRPVAVQNWFSNWLLQSAERGVFYVYGNAIFGGWRPGGATCVSAAAVAVRGRTGSAGAGATQPRRSRRGGRGGAGGGGARRARGDRRDFAKGLLEGTFRGTLRRDFSKGLFEGTFAGTFEGFNIYTWFQ